MAKKRGGCTGGGQVGERPSPAQVVDRPPPPFEPKAVKPIPSIVDDKKKRKEEE